MEQPAAKSKKKSLRKKLISGTLIVLILTSVIIAGFFMLKIVSPASGTGKTTYLYIDENKDYKAVLEQLEMQSQLKDIH